MIESVGCQSPFCDHIMSASVSVSQPKHLILQPHAPPSSCDFFKSFAGAQPDADPLRPRHHRPGIGRSRGVAQCADLGAEPFESRWRNMTYCAASNVTFQHQLERRGDGAPDVQSERSMTPRQRCCCCCREERQLQRLTAPAAIRRGAGPDPADLRPETGHIGQPGTGAQLLFPVLRCRGKVEDISEVRAKNGHMLQYVPVQTWIKIQYALLAEPKLGTGR